MEIYILSKGRPRRQPTWDSLPASIQARTKIAVYPEEVKDYSAYPTIAVTCKERGVGFKRQWLIEQCKRNKILMLDDDLTYARRRQDEPEKFTGAEPLEVEELFADLEKHLGEYAHVGVSSREGGNYKTADYLTIGRSMRILGYQIDVLKAQGLRLDEMQLMEDFNTTLTLLRAGYPNLIVNWMVHNQAGSNTSGGVSTYRTLQRQAEAAHELARRHPHYVAVVEKETKAAWGGGIRTDVRVQWRKAYESSK